MERNGHRHGKSEPGDFGGAPLTVNIDRAAKENSNFRTALWSGKHLQVTLMSIPVGGDIGIEMHPDVDQFIRIESGLARVMMGKDKKRFDFRRRADANFAIIIPAGTWHNIVNIGNTPLKVYSIYAPPQHPFGTVHRTKREAEEAEKH